MKNFTLLLMLFASLLMANEVKAQFQADFTFTVDTFSCDSGTITFVNTSTAPPNATFVWEFSSNSPFSPWVWPGTTPFPLGVAESGLASYNYVLLYMYDSGGNFIDSTGASISWNSLSPQITFTYTSSGGSSCFGPQVYTFDAQDLSPNTNVSNWQWFVDGANAGNGSTMTYTFLPDVYQVLLVGSDVNGCSASYMLPITVGTSNMQVGISHSVINSDCQGALVDLFSTVNGGVPPYTYNWTWYDFGNSTDPNPQQQFILAEDPTVYLTVTDANGCIASTSQFVQFSTNTTLNPVISLDTTISDCNTSTLHFSGNADPSVIAWDWFFIDGVGNQYQSTVQNPIITVPAGANYVNAILTVYDANNCSDVNDFIIVLDTVGLAVTANVDIGTGCSGANCDATIEVFATGGTGPYTYTLNQGNPSASNVFDNLCDGTYVINVQDALGCSTLHTVVVSTSQNQLNLQYSENYEACTGSGNGSFIQVWPSGGVSPYAFSWSSGEVTQILSNPTPGSTYTVIVTDAAGCTVSQTFNVPINDCFIISGNIWVDINGDCMVNGNDYPLSNVFVDLADANGNWLWIYDYADANGNYSISAPAGTYYFDVNGFNTNNYTQVCPAGNFSVTVDQNNPSAVVDFFFTPPPPTQDLSVTIGHITNVAPSTIPGQNRWSYIQYCNDGTIPMSGTVVWNYSNELTYAGPGYTNIVPDIIDQANHQLTFNFSNLMPGECEYVRINFDVPNTMQIGTVINDEVVVNPIPGDVTPANNTTYSSELSVGSWDPNDKAVYPHGDITEDQNDHDYHIRFQNEGNANATRVIVRDVLDANLDLHSLRNVHSSHNFILTIENDNELVFTFDNIQLPPMDVDEAGSQGYVAFTISQLDDLPIGTDIENTAAIYFDFNEAVITNTVVNTIVDKSTGIKDIANNISMHLYPNPARESVHVSLDNNEVFEEIVVFDIIGNQVLGITDLQTNTYTLNTANLTSGVYVMEANTANGKAVKRFVVANE